MAPGLCSIIKVEEVRDPLQEAPDKVSEALVLFCQGQGLLPTINRRASRQGLQISEGARSVLLPLSISLSALSHLNQQREIGCPEM